MGPVEALSEQENHLWYVWRVLRKRLWMIIAVYVAITVTLSVDAMKKPPMYRATAQLLIEHENPNIIPFEEAVGKEYVHDSDVPSSSYYKTQYKILQSRSMARRVIRTLNLQDHPVFTDADAPSLLQTLQALPKTLLTQLMHGAKGLITPNTETHTSQVAQVNPDPESALIGRFLSHLAIEPVSDTRLVNIHFTARTPHLAAEVANTLSSIYVDQNLEMRFAASQESVDWLHRRVQDMRDKVEQAEFALQRYKEEHNIVSFEEHQNTIVKQLADLNRELAKTNTNIIGVETLYQQTQKLKDQPDLVESIPSIANNIRIQTLKQDRDSLIQLIAKLEERLKPQHPDLLKYQEKIREIQQKVDFEINNVLSSIDIDYHIKKLRLEKLREAFEEYKTEAQNLNKTLIKYNVLSLDAKSNKDLYDVLPESMKGSWSSLRPPVTLTI